MNGYIFQMPNGSSIVTIAANVREAIDALHATGERSWLLVRGNEEDAILQRADYERLLEDELKWEKSMRLQLMESFIESLKPKEIVDNDPNKPVYVPQIPAAAKARIEQKKQLSLAI